MSTILTRVRRAIGVLLGRDEQHVDVSLERAEYTHVEGALQEVPNYAGGIDTLAVNDDQPRLAGMHSIPLDVTYQLPERADLEAAVRLDRTDLLPWEREFFDCEAFAMALPYLLARDYGINSVGLVIDATGGHAYNVAVVAGADVVFIEPQGAPGDPSQLSETYYEPEAFPVDASHRLERGWIIL